VRGRRKEKAKGDFANGRCERSPKGVLVAGVRLRKSRKSPLKKKKCRKNPTFWWTVRDSPLVWLKQGSFDPFCAFAIHRSAAENSRSQLLFS